MGLDIYNAVVLFFHRLTSAWWIQVLENKDAVLIRVFISNYWYALCTAM